MAFEPKTIEITHPGVYALGLVTIYYDEFVQQDGTKSASIRSLFDNGRQHLNQRFFFFDRGRWNPQRSGHSLGNLFVQMLFAGLAPEALFPLLGIYEELMGGGADEAEVQEKMVQEIQNAEREAQEIIKQKGLGWPPNLEDVSEWEPYINGGEINGEQFGGWSELLVDNIYAIWTIETSGPRGNRIVIPQKKDAIGGVPFMILPIWWGPGTGVQELNPEYKLPYSNLTPEEWVAHAKKVRSEIAASRGGPRIKEVSDKGINVFDQMAKLGLGLKSSGSGGPAQPEEPDSDDGGEDDPPF